MKKLTRIFAMGLVLIMAMSLFTGCSKADPSAYAGQVAAKIGDKEIGLDEANFFVRYNQKSMEPYYWDYYSYLGYANMWEAPSSDNYDQTLATALKQSAMNELLQTKFIIGYADQFGVSLTDSDMARVKETVDAVMKYDEKFFALAPVTEEQLTGWFTENALAVKIFKTVKSQATVSVADEDCTMYTVKYITIPDMDEFVQTIVEEGQEVKQDPAKAEAEYIVNAVNNEGKDFDETLVEFSATSTSASYLKKNTESSGQVETMAMGMKAGEAKAEHVDGTGWYVVYCVTENDEAKTAEKRTALEEEQRVAYFAEEFKKLYEASGVTFEVMDCFDDIEVSDGSKYFVQETSAAPVTVTETTAAETGTGETTAGETAETETTAEETTAAN